MLQLSDKCARYCRASAAALLVIAFAGCSGRGGSDGATQGGATPTPAPTGSASASALVRANTLYSPIRIAAGPDGKLFVTDSNSNSLFILRNLLAEGELKGLAHPLGVAVDAAGNIYVGNDNRDNVEVYDSSGNKLREIGAGTIQMPNSLALDRDGNLYVADSLANAIKVYATDGRLLRTVGGAMLQFPVSITVAYRTANGGAGEIYVADQMHTKIQVFNLTGAFQRSFGTKLTLGSPDWHGKFVQLQSLAVDASGRLHVLDSTLARVQILDAVTGAYLDSYGSIGSAEGQLNLPLDIAITGNNQVMVTNYGNHRVDMLRDLN